MKYVLMLCSDLAYRDDLAEAAKEGCGDWTAEMTARGVLVSSIGLRPSEDATTVRVRGSELLLTDGPFTETKDQVGGMTLIDCADLDEALEVAAAHPWAKVGQIEVRPTGSEP